ncbi:MAG: class I adenylate-forming enzyme family protein [Actinomycetota bacterium]
MTLAATVREAGRRFGDRTAFVDPDGARLSYAELDVRSDEVARGLIDQGILPGDVVLLRLPSDSSYVIAYAAAAKVGAVAAGVNPRLAPPEQASVAAAAGAALTLTEAAHLEELRRRGGAPPPLGDDAERPVALVFTSGTTGQPKGALFRDRQLAAVTRIDVADAWGDPSAPTTQMLASTQFAHVGFMTKLAWYLRLGTTTHILGRWRAADALACIVEQRMTSIGGVAPQIALLLKEDLESYDLSCVQTLVVGGAASPPAMVREAKARFDAAYSIRYSSTESGGCGTGTAFDADEEEALFTVGSPRGGIEVSIHPYEDGAGHGFGTTDAPLEPGDVGEVWLRSPTTMSEYWNDPEATAAALHDGWLRTGDLGLIDERGLLRLAGRKTEMFIRGGYNVYPAEVEGALADHPRIAEVAVVPRPDDVMGEIGVAVVVPSEPARPPTLDDLREFLAPKVARYKIPEALRLVDELPLTPMQKIDRRSLAAAEAEVVAEPPKL